LSFGVTVIKCIIFDLDNTIVDTECLSRLRKTKKWKECVRILHKTELFDGIIDILDKIKHEGILIGIVTNSVSFYAEAVLKYYNINYDTLVAYHDCPTGKPNPGPINLCLRRLRVMASETIGIGDSFIDATAYRAANIKALGAGWSPYLDRSAPWDKILSSPDDIERNF
jgi:N-acetyl-D-muramate 6-phosphate phosphatase